MATESETKPAPVAEKPGLAASSSLPKFPISFNLYRKRGPSRTYMLSQHCDEPMLALSRHRGFSDRPDVLLHAGTSFDDPPLATVNLHGLSHKITLDIHPAGGVGTVEQFEGKYDMKFPYGTYVFPLPVANGGTETFEWKYLRGAALRDIRGDFTGWVLRRQDVSHSEGGKSEADFTPGQGTEEGKEIVSAWTELGLNTHKAAQFHFLGAGAFGRKWELAAVISALGIYERRRRRKQCSAPVNLAAAGGWTGD